MGELTRPEGSAIEKATSNDSGSGVALTASDAVEAVAAPASPGPELLERYDVVRGDEHRELVDRVRELEREQREILKAWGLGDVDHMNAAMLVAFLREFGKAPVPANEETAE